MGHSSSQIVVGGGIVGCWTAWHLAKRGCQVTVLERDQIGSGASSGNCGFICPGHVHPLCAPGAISSGMRTMARWGGALSIPPRWDPTLWRWLVQFSRHCNQQDFVHASRARHALLHSSRTQYRQFASQHGSAFQWQFQGLLLVYQSKQDFESYERHASELAQDFDVEVDRYDGDEVSQLEPSLRDGLAGGWHFPNDAHLSPQGLLDELCRQIEQMGGQIRPQTEITKLEFNASTLTAVQSATGERFSADGFVFTTGAEAGYFADQLGCRLPVIPGKGYSVTIDHAPVVPKIPMIFESDHVAVTPLGSSLRIGSTMQLTGFSRSIPAKRIELLKRSAREHLKPSQSGSPPQQDCQEKRWSGWRPMMPDDIPCIGPAPRAGNAMIAAGNGMIGMASGPATGQLTCELALGLTPHLDPTPYRVDRFDR
ncbi:FAD-dependent oxidoreductase [Stieleria sp. TO1_6]|uniref:NAD(P)/FAD-dependent oxidoreductase n=1 Tax=Stieleria tagensis TaxID=2956795 RepID=UPI00209B7A39|nr:FAD-dependent oxidoreductase [Stieleria tagensis]MCO8124487.1 FAD-dependent oxidoreductase [Stieleria tagensis]